MMNNQQDCRNNPPTALIPILLSHKSWMPWLSLPIMLMITMIIWLQPSLSQGCSNGKTNWAKMTVKINSRLTRILLAVACLIREASGRFQISERLAPMGICCRKSRIRASNSSKNRVPRARKAAIVAMEHHLPRRSSRILPMASMTMKKKTRKRIWSFKLHRTHSTMEKTHPAQTRTRLHSPMPASKLISSRLFLSNANKRDLQSKKWSPASANRSSKFSTISTSIVSTRVDVECFSKWSKQLWTAPTKVTTVPFFNVWSIACFQ